MPGAEMLERPDEANRNDGYAELLCHAESAILKFTHVAAARALGLRKMTRLVPESMASCVNRHMRFKSDGRRTSGTGTFPNLFISEP